MLTNILLAAPAKDPRILHQEVVALDTLAKAEYFFPIALGIAGVLMLFLGWKAYKPIVVLNCIALGFWVGGLLGQQAQITTVAAIIGGLVLGAVSWPLMKYAVALCGALVGAVLGMVVWTYFQPEYAHLAWAGGLVGMVLFGMLSFTLFKTNVILFTCMQGAAMVVLGVSAVLIKATPWQQEIHANLTGKPILMPLLTVAVAVLGIVFQQQKHGLVGNDGAPAGKSGGGKPADAAKK